MGATTESRGLGPLPQKIGRPPTMHYYHTHCSSGSGGGGSSSTVVVVVVEVVVVYYYLMARLNIRCQKAQNKRIMLVLGLGLVLGLVLTNV